MFGAFIIGDELLVGKREDKHLAFLIGALARLLQPFELLARAQ